MNRHSTSASFLPIGAARAGGTGPWRSLPFSSETEAQVSILTIARQNWRSILVFATIGLVCAGFGARFCSARGSRALGRVLVVLGVLSATGRQRQCGGDGKREDGATERNVVSHGESPAQGAKVGSPGARRYGCTPASSGAWANLSPSARSEYC